MATTSKVAEISDFAATDFAATDLAPQPAAQPGTPQPTVSVLTATRDAAATIARAMDAVAGQRLTRWEHLVYVPESDPAARRCVENYIADDPRYRLVTGPTSSASQARNTLIAQARGEFVVFLDADDTFGPNHLKVLVREARRNNVSWVIGGYCRVDKDGLAYSERRPPSDLSHALSRASPTALHSMLFGRYLIERVNGFDTELDTFEDWDLCRRIAACDARYAAADITSAQYWTTPGSLSSSIPGIMDGYSAALNKFSGDGCEGENALAMLRTATWCGALAIARGNDPAPAAEFLVPLPPASVEPTELSDALLDGFSVGFALPPEEVEAALAGRWDELTRFMDHVATCTAQTGLGGAVLREFEYQLARVGSASVRRMINATDYRPFLSRPFKALSCPPEARQLVLRLPLVRPRRQSMAAFAPQWADGHSPAALAGGVLLRRLADLGSRQGSALSPLRRSIWRALRMAVKLRQKLLRRTAAEQSMIDPQELATDDRWEMIFRDADPWNYTSRYEVRKYEETLALLPSEPIRKALELACAEGLFTARLAERVSELSAVDISPTALRRAEDHCRKNGCDNIAFGQLDFFDSELGKDWNLIVCSEVLYYMPGTDALRSLARRVSRALVPGGCFIHAHAYQTADSPDRTAFEWNDDFAVETISRTFQERAELQLEAVTETELYRIERYRKAPEPVPAISHVTQSIAADLDPALQADVVWNRTFTSRAHAENETTSNLPVLAYHSVAGQGPDGLSPWRIDPAAFERQLRFLRRRGYRSVTLEDFRERRRTFGRFSGRPIMLTFDDGYADFATDAWPILKRNGFGAVVFAVTDLVGKTSEWDAHFGPPAPLMDWKTIRQLSEDGVEFGSHLANHQPLTQMDPASALDSMVRSRRALLECTEQTVCPLAPPFGLYARQHCELARMAGYEMLFGVDGGIASLHGPAFSVPRIEIRSDMDLHTFSEAIAAQEPPQPWEYAG